MPVPDLVRDLRDACQGLVDCIDDPETLPDVRAEEKAIRWILSDFITALERPSGTQEAAHG
jgi:hypothetical protein